MSTTDLLNALLAKKGQDYYSEFVAFMAQLLADNASILSTAGQAVASSSTTSLAIGTGSKSLTVAANKAFAAGQFVTIAVTADVTQYMFGAVSSYNASSGALVVSVSDTAGSGTYAAWTVSLVGPKGATGATGSLSGGNLTGALNESAVTLASAATTDLGAAAGNAVRVTGTNSITALGTAQSGSRRHVTFSGTLTLTHNATSLILPGAANIVTAAGDTAEFESLGAGNWRCMEYNRAVGLPLLATGGNAAGPITATVTTMTASSNTFTPNCALGNEFDCGTIAAASTIANPTNPPASGLVQPLTIKWTQDGTGGRTVSFGANCINIGGTSANTAAGKVNFAVGKVYSDGKFYYSIVKGA